MTGSNDKDGDDDRKRDDDDQICLFFFSFSASECVVVMVTVISGWILEVVIFLCCVWFVGVFFLEVATTWKWSG
ncbi:hypothetical protein QYF36_016140 [Acer negundo]|nr:hypothetical protein QYF36_016140 [Acer negundo]